MTTPHPLPSLIITEKRPMSTALDLLGCVLFGCILFLILVACEVV